MNEETHQAMLEQREAFIKKFGRQPGPDDPVFFDPDADTPQPFNSDTYARELAEAMAAAGIDPALIYAAKKTGLLVTEDNRHLIPDEAMEEWAAALREYKELTKGEPF